MDTNHTDTVLHKERNQESLITVCAYYKFQPVADPERMREKLRRLCKKHIIKGLTLLGTEGINGTMAGSDAAMKAFRAFIEDDLGFAPLDWKVAYTSQMPFMRLKIKVKNEICTSGVPTEANPIQGVGIYTDPKEWNALITRDDTVVVDVRNDFEVQMGTFAHARNPHTTSFREFAAYVDKELSAYKDTPIAMCCTGGIRCEKSTAYLKAKGFQHVYHLKGGILRYLEEMPKEQSLWSGECFVFDERVSVDHDLKPGSYELCHGCRLPINATHKASVDYEEGVSCPQCINIRTDDQKSRARERHHQITLAKARNRSHRGDCSVIEE
ncbi:MAG: rhodanese-related sulfurtransferase [Alphaproteobacteria bacterium]|nr:MAG: rhodanese-related sulfurtransferase [Alphaproteobacteria bacterium]